MSPLVPSAAPAIGFWPNPVADGVAPQGKTGGDLVECWGDNQFAELGDGTTTGRRVPVAVLGLERATAP